MNKVQIPHPKVFISYARGDEDYQRRILSFATSLRRDGIDVVLDLWHLSEGNDTHYFMERCVKDDSITNVLMLLDPVYAEKADSYSGGVGTETQIISSKVYHDANNSKFLPVVFQRNQNGDVCKPVYLQSRLYFDLSVEDRYDAEYKHLVRKLYGVNSYPVPELGTMPSWVQSERVVDTKLFAQYDILKKNENSRIKRTLFSSFLDEIRNGIINYRPEGIPDTLLVEFYDGLKDIRIQYVSLISYYIYVESGVKMIADFLETTKTEVDCPGKDTNRIKAIFLHEIFLYSVAVLIKCKDFSGVNTLLGRTYFCSQYSGGTLNATTYNAFYSGSVQSNFSTAICNRDSTDYYSGTAHYWSGMTDPSLCSRDDLVLADLICYNYSILHKCVSWSGFYWFPELYAYDNEFHSVLREIGVRLISRERLALYMPMFGFDNADAFKETIKEIMAKIKAKEIERYRYSGSFETAHVLFDFIDPDEIGTLP